MSEEKEKPRDFELIPDSQDVLRFLAEGSKSFAAVMIWTDNQEMVINTHLALLNAADRFFYTSTPPDLNLPIFIDHLARKSSAEVFFSVSLASANLFFKAKFRDADGTGLKFDLPAKTYKVQRRKDVRFQIPEGYLLKVEFQDPLFPGTTHSRKVFDISAGGMSFIVPEQDAPLFTEGLILHGIQFTLRGKKIITEGEVRHARPLPARSKEQGTKVGILFKKLAQLDNQAITAYVFDETRKYFSRFL